MTFLTLHGTHTSIILEQAEGLPPLWRHWGPRLAEPLPPLLPRATPSFSPETDIPLTIAPSFGNGWFGEPCLLAHRNGQAFQQHFTLRTAHTPTPDTLRLDLTDDPARLSLAITLRLDANDMLHLSTTLTNEGADTLTVQWLASGVLPIPGEATTLHATVGRHLDEFHAETIPLTRFGWRRQTRRGITGHDAFPAALLTLPGCTADTGTAYAAHLAWSGNHQAVLDWVEDGRFQFQWGEWLAPGEMRLAPGASLTTPTLLATCSLAGTNGIAQAFHAEARRRLRWPGGHMHPRPVTMNTWEGFYFDHDTEQLQALATRAAAIGVERFVLDDGWFEGRSDDTAALGDWTPDPIKYPNGLAPLIAHVSALGMQFGLWVEPEMANPNSQLLRTHPHWALAAEGRPLLTARNQLVLDLSRPEVAAYLYDRLAALLQAHPIAYLKWDHNRDLAPAAGVDGTARYHAQVLATAALLARVAENFPAVEIEACAGGGGRIDFSILQHTHRFWASDTIDARARLPIQRGFLHYLPPELMGAHVGAAKAHTSGRTQSLAFRAAVALPGHFGLEFDLATLTTTEERLLTEWVTLHKSLRPLLHGTTTWQGIGQDGLLWQMHGNPAGERLLAIYRLDPASFRHPPPLRLPMEGTGPWRVTPIATPGTKPRHATGWHLALSGHLLATLGLPLPQLGAEEALLLHLAPHTETGP